MVLVAVHGGKAIEGTQLPPRRLLTVNVNSQRSTVNVAKAFSPSSSDLGFPRPAGVLLLSLSQCRC